MGYGASAQAQICVGTCGTLGADGSVPLPPGGATTYNYVSTVGGVTGAGEIANVGGTDGSQFTTATFTAAASMTVTFQFDFVTSDGSGSYADYAWAALAPASSAPIYLFTARTESSGAIVPGSGLPGVSATLTPSSVSISAGTTWSALGGDSGTCYGGAGYGCGNTGWVQGSYTIASTGNYKLEFGVTNFVDTYQNSGLAYGGITVGGTSISGGVSTSTPIDTAAQFYLASNLGSTVTADFQGGTLKADVSSITSNFTVENDAGNTIDAHGMGVNFSGVLSGAGGLTIEDTAGGGKVIFTAVNTYTGLTTINAGATLALTGSGSIANSDPVVYGTLDLSGVSGPSSILNLSGAATGAVTLGANTLIITAAIIDPFAGVISGTGGVSVTGGTQYFSGANIYTGATTIAAMAGLNLIGSGSIASSSVVTANGTLDISGLTNGGTSIVSLAGAGAVTLSVNTLTLTGAGDTFAGVISGAGGLAVEGGTETLTGANTFAGAATINSGATLALAGAGSISSASGVVNNGVFSISGTTSGALITSLSGSGQVALGSQTLTLTGTGDTFAGVISGAGGLTVEGGTETLTGANTFAGAATINSGATLALAGAGSISSASGVVDNGVFSISATTAGASIATLSGSGGVTLGARTLTLVNGTGTFAGVISGSGELKVSGGTETLTGANTLTGATTIASGATVALSGSGGLASSDVADSGVLNISGATTVSAIKGLNGTGSAVLGSKTLALTGANDSFAGVISGSGGLAVAAGTETLTGANTFTGAATINSGATLQLGAGGTTGSVAGNVAATGTLVFNLSNTVTYGGVISGAGAINQAGSGTTILNGANTFTGVATVSAGVLEIGDAAHGAASLGGSVVVAANGTLAGHGGVAGSVTNTAGGTVSPGGTIGMLTVGAYTQGANSTLAIEVSPTAASMLNVLGAASLNGKLALTFDAGAYSAHIYEIVAGAPVSGTFSSVTTTGAPGIAYGVYYAPDRSQVDLVTEGTGNAQAFGAISSATLTQAQNIAGLVEDRFGDAGCADRVEGANRGLNKMQDVCMGMRAWAQAVGTTDRVNTNSSGLGWTGSSTGFLGGIDRRWLSGDTLGVALGYAFDTMSVDAAASKASGASYYGALYGRWTAGRAWFDGQAFYMHSDWTLNRYVSGYGKATSAPSGDTKGLLAQASTPLGGNGDLRPYVRVIYASFDRQTTTEAGVGPLGYTINGGATDLGLIEAGLLYSHSFVGGIGKEVRPALQLGVQDTFAGLNSMVYGSLAGVGNTDFSVNAQRQPSVAGVIDASLKVKLNGRFELTAGLRGRFSTAQTEASATLGGVFRF
jgi:autotransporter-associated beta strand protein